MGLSASGFIEERALGAADVTLRRASGISAHAADSPNTAAPRAEKLQSSQTGASGRVGLGLVGNHDAFSLRDLCPAPSYWAVDRERPDLGGPWLKLLQSRPAAKELAVLMVLNNYRLPQGRTC